MQLTSSIKKEKGKKEKAILSRTSFFDDQLVCFSTYTLVIPVHVEHWIGMRVHE